jgi:hypothetical protein
LTEDRLGQWGANAQKAVSKVGLGIRHDVERQMLGAA